MGSAFAAAGAAEAAEELEAAAGEDISLHGCYADLCSSAFGLLLKVREGLAELRPPNTHVSQ